jgi:IMP and pyridine-specific 5'-nucleotidase
VQIHASAEALRLITFDADGTLYADGHHFEQDNEMIQLFMSLMKVGGRLVPWLPCCILCACL